MNTTAWGLVAMRRRVKSEKFKVETRRWHNANRIIFCSALYSKLERGHGLTDTKHIHRAFEL